MTAEDGFEHHDGELWAESVPLREIAERFGTPCYVYSRAAVEARWARYQAAVGDRGSVCYAVKANGSLALLGLLAEHGAGFDIVSGGELARVLRASGDPGRVVFSGVGKGVGEIRRALGAGIRCFNVESAAELERLAAIAGEAHTPAPVAIRINPDVEAPTHRYIATGQAESKFGVPLEEARELYRRAAAEPALRVRGLAFHIGSQLMSVGPLEAAAERAAALVRELQAEGIAIEHIDAGGGLGVRYTRETPPTPSEHVEALAGPLAGLGAELIVEPGRALIAEAGLLLTRVEYLKQGGARRFAVVDAGMNDYLRPALYSAEHAIEAVAPGEAPERRLDIVGPVCESADVFATDRALPAAAGDLLAVRSAGAYGAAMASQYNGRPRPPEILVDGAHTHLIRRREGPEDLMRGERLLPGG